jgi:hypothetical protein
MYITKSLQKSNTIKEGTYKSTECNPQKIKEPYQKSE